MSSYKIFKDSSKFTQVSLVNESINGTITANHTRNNTKLPAADESILSVKTAGGANNKTTIEHEISVAEHGQPIPVDIETINAKAHARGKQEAEQDTCRELHLAIDAFTCACTEINDLHKNMLEQSRGDTINLVMALSKKIIDRELNTDREAIIRTLQQAIEISLDSSGYDIWLNPNDLDIVEKKRDGFSEQTNGLKQIRLRTDPSISRGGCRLESSICTVDATIEAQLISVGEFLEENVISWQATEDKEKATKLKVQSSKAKT